MRSFILDFSNHNIRMYHIIILITFRTRLKLKCFSRTTGIDDDYLKFYVDAPQTMEIIINVYIMYTYLIDFLFMPVGTRK